MKRTLKFTRIYPHPPELVWEALTDSEAMAEWLMENDFQPRVGHAFQLRTSPAPGFDGIVDCTVLAVEELRRLSFSWRGGPIDTVITFTLERVKEGTRLTVEQSGFDGLKAVVVSYILQTGIRKIYEENLPRVLAQLADGTFARKGGALCEEGENATTGARVLAHVANILPGGGNKQNRT